MTKTFALTICFALMAFVSANAREKIAPASEISIDTSVEIVPVDYSEKTTIETPTISAVEYAKKIDMVVEAINSADSAEVINVIRQLINEVGSVKTFDIIIAALNKADMLNKINAKVDQIFGASNAKVLNKLKWYEYDGISDAGTGIWALMKRAKYMIDNGQDVSELYSIFLEMVNSLEK